MSTTNPRGCGRALLSLAIAAALAPAHAQTALEEVVVTAQKREENIQQTPIAITALSSETLEKTGIQNIGDLRVNTPGLTGSEAVGSRGNFSIGLRGVSAGNPSSASVDPATALYIDGVYLGKSMGNSLDVADVERIEILRGPQGTLYGRNSTAGAINFVTRKPSGEFHLKATGTVGNYDLRGIKTVIDLPSIGTPNEGLGTLAASLAVQARNRDDLYGNTNPDQPGFENLHRNARRLNLQWQVRDDFTVDYAYDYSYLREHTNLEKVVGFVPLSMPAGAPVANQSIASSSRIATMNSLLGAVNGLAPTQNTQRLATWLRNAIDVQQAALAGGKSRPGKGSSDDAPIYSNEGEGHALTLSWDAGQLGALGDVSFKSISAYRETQSHQLGDIDGIDNRVVGGAINDTTLVTIASSLLNPATAAYANGLIDRLAQSYVAGGFALNTQVNYRQFSEELQMNGSTDRVEYNLGLYYFSDSASTRSVTSPVFPISASTVGSYDNGAKALAVYGQGTWTPPLLSDRLAITAGLRYTKETKDITYLWRAAPNGVYTSSLGEAATYPIDPAAYGKKFKQNFYNTSGTLTAAYQFTDDINAFIRYATAYRSGGFNGDFFDYFTDQPNAFSEETMEQWEIGVKSDWWSKRLRVNASLYQYTYKDLQVSQVLTKPNGAVANGFTNAGKADRWGAELEVTVMPIDDLLASFSYNYVHGDFDEYADNCAPAADGGACSPNPEKYAYRPQSPSNQWTLALDYTVARLKLGEVTAHVDANWQDAWYTVAQSAAVYDTNGNRVPDRPVIYEPMKADERLLVNARLSLEKIPVGEGAMQVSLWSKNLFNQDYRNNGTNFGNSLGTVVAMFGEPRTYGLDLTYEY